MFGYSYYSFSFTFICIEVYMKYITKGVFLAILVASSLVGFGQAKPTEEIKTSPYLYMLGQIATYPPLTALIQSLDSGQLEEIFSLANNEYEMRSYEKGISLIFNQNFVLKEVQFYDSGYVFSPFEGELPMALDFSMRLSDFANYTYDAFEVDTFNKFIYHGDLGVGHAKVYFKDNHILSWLSFLAQTTVSLVTAQNQLPYRSEWGMRIIPGGSCA